MAILPAVQVMWAEHELQEAASKRSAESQVLRDVAVGSRQWNLGDNTP